jgi:hypothetical protein
VAEIKEKIQLQSQEKEKEPKRSQADILVELATGSDIELFHELDGTGYAAIYINSHREIWKVSGPDFKKYLCHKYWIMLQKAPSNEAIRSAISVIEGMCEYEGCKQELYNRICNNKNSIYYDLSNDNWQSVEVNSEGWTIVEPPILFKRLKHQAPQLIPLKGGNIHKLLDYINLKENKFLFLVYVVSCFIPDIPHPILTLYGQKGAAKSTTSIMLKKIIDPSVMELITFPKNQDELVLQLDHHYYVPFDNLSGLQDWASDSLCRACTGEAVSKRALYSNDEDCIFRFKSCILLNGINVSATLEDLLDRSILLELERISGSNRKTMSEIWESFDNEKPLILGNIFDVLSKAIKLKPSIKLGEKPRMADFTEWGFCIGESIETGGGNKFLEEYWSSVDVQSQEAINSNPVGLCVINFMDNKTQWEGKASQLLGELEEVAAKERIDRGTKYFPRSANALARRLNSIKSNLIESGIEYKSVNKYITLTRKIPF